MQFILTLHVQEAGWDQLTPAQQQEGMAAYGAFTQALTEAGALVGVGRLMPSGGARTVRTVGGKTVVMDGPFAETKEQMGGYFIIEAADLGAATAWASRCPATGHGIVEVRALRP